MQDFMLYFITCFGPLVSMNGIYRGLKMSNNFAFRMRGLHNASQRVNYLTSNFNALSLLGDRQFNFGVKPICLPSWNTIIFTNKIHNFLFIIVKIEYYN
jgi:hypothetical protein